MAATALLGVGLLAAGTAARAAEMPPSTAASDASVPTAGAAVPAVPAGPDGRKAPRRPVLDGAFVAMSPQAVSPVISLGQTARLPVIIPERLRPTEAMRVELREQALDSRRAQVFGNLPDMPELLDDDFVLRERSRAAESIMGSAVERAIAVAFQGEVRHESSLSVRPEFTTVDHGFKVDASPSWSYKVVGVRTGMRLDVPLTPRSLRLRAWRELRGTDRNPQRLGAGLTIDPFDQSVRCGMTFEF